MYTYMTHQFHQESDNIIVLFYYSLACLLVRKYNNCLEALRLVRTLHALNYQSKGAMLIDYYKAKSEKIEALVKTLAPSQRASR